MTIFTKGEKKTLPSFPKTDCWGFYSRKRTKKTLVAVTPINNFQNMYNFLVIQIRKSRS